MEENTRIREIRQGLFVTGILALTFGLKDGNSGQEQGAK